MKGEKTKLFDYYRGKKITVEIVNPIDKRMAKFMLSRWNYHPEVSSKAWIRDNYIQDKVLLRYLGWKLWSSLSLEERIEVKANYMVRQHVWKRFHIWNRKHVPRWRVKYSEETDFKITIKDETRKENS